ncbi:DnaJ domain-containing protein [Colletotrichum karsti]|uniref:DnaJ domain-containing protein n=1 Tax=Colletotrichum karsti TaxID=1095194 RepID=A0A9P6I813_9PEZI|nr:DnaJ domain-containing protein [Colletotrichum karsti]KAF9875676.1 DnaJ domain-containing protein [Colletotrichum karsti]
MTAKRPRSPDLIPNPFIKKRNLEWSLDVPHADDEEEEEEEVTPARSSDRPGPSLSATLESGAATHPDPAAHFFSHLARHTLSPYPASAARLADGGLEALFESNAGRRGGAHFVVHQHDHPVAGPHYDLRLQVNERSSVSWAVMYGLPGDANSKRLNRNATETRVHCLWNHVVETASWYTGSLVIWDCGVYEVLERGRGGGPEVDPDSGREDEEDDDVDGSGMTEQEKLARAFRERKIRVRLHGSKLPRGYVLNLRLTRGEDAEGRRRSEKLLAGPARKRRRRKGEGAGVKKDIVVETSSEEDEDADDDLVPDAETGAATETNVTDVERELRELEDETVRMTNAYKGAENSVGSVHQRRWYMSLDREASGDRESVYVMSDSRSIRSSRTRRSGGGGGGGSSSSGAPRHSSERHSSERHSSERHSSARHSSSAAVDDNSYLRPSNRSMRSSARSVRSVNSQFAATRREYDFDDDDEESMVDRMTIASEAEFTGGDDSTVTIGDFAPQEDADGLEGDYYDLLCLPKDPTITPDQVRKAYYRLILYLHMDGLPESLHPIAKPWLDEVQRGFETLIDPHRRALYDANQMRDLPVDEDYRYGYDVSLKEQLRQRAADVVQTSSDLGIRFDASKAVRQGAAFTPLDFTLSHSVTVGLPPLGRLMGRSTQSGDWAPSASKRVPSIAVNEKTKVEQKRESMLYLPPPQLTLTGSVYGIVEEIYRVPLPLLADRYQPLLPLTIPRKRIIQLAEQRPCPLISLKFRQDIIHRNAEDRIAKTTVEVESEVLPESSLTTRLTHPIHLPNSSNPVILEGSVRTGRPWFREPPRLAVGLHRWLGAGTAYAFADSGDWSMWPGQTIKLISDFSQISKTQLLTEFPMKTSASLEIGYTTSPERVPSAGHEDSPKGECGIRGLDNENRNSSDDSWTVSTSLTATAVAGYLRYGRDLPLSGSKATRLEVELCSNTLLDRYVAVRNLWNIGRFSKLGLEVGVSLHSLHLSLYWSRLSQRLSIPLLLSPRAEYSPQVFFYATAVPLVAFAAKHFFAKPKRAVAAAALPSGVDLQSYIARKRAAADDVTALLGPPIEARQRVEKQRGGLVILSAKFGVKDGADWAALEEVADVTFALAALIEDGKLRIPAGVRKGSLLGFWDPAPLRRKALHVRYLYRGKERTVEVMGRDELVLPPSKRSVT